VVVRITSEMSRALSDRIRGQTSDLSIELVTVDTGPLESSLPAQVGSATTVAQVYDADAVVWFDDIGTGPTGEKRLLVMQTKAKRLLLRGVGDQSAPSPKHPPSESAQLEAASLIVRIAVQAMMQGVMIGVEQARIVGPEPEKPPPPPLPPPPKPFEVGDTAGALPGVVRVPVAATFERIGFGAAASGGYAYTEAILGEGDVHQRVFASLAASFRTNEWLAFALRLDGRYDWHRHVSTGDSSGWVGEPHVVVRTVPNMTGSFRVGAEANVGFPGEQVPSIDPAATSPELSLFATYAPASASYALTSLVGFRVDRGAHTVDEPDRLSRSQRVSIGASDTNALLLGLGTVAHVAKNWDALGEWTWDLRVPSNGTSALESPMRLDAGARFTPKDSGTLAFQFLIEVSPSARPTIAAGEPLVVVDPRVGIVVGMNILPKRAHSPLDEPTAISFQPNFPRGR
jgi:hypothetical protein